MYFIVAILVFIAFIIISGIVMDKNFVKPTSPYTRDEEEWVKAKLALSGFAFVAGALWPLTIAGLIIAGAIFIILKITGFLLAIGNKFKKG